MHALSLKSRFLITVLFLYTGSFCQVNKEVDSLLKVLNTQQEDSNMERTLNRIGQHYIDNNPGKALEYFDRSAALAKALHFPLREGNTYYDIAFCYLLKGNFDQSLDYYQQAATIYEQLNDKRRLANAYMSIGSVFFQTKQLTKTREYYGRAEEIARQRKDSGQLSQVISERGLVYDQMQEYDSALLYLQGALAIARLSHNENEITNSQSNIGLTYKHKKNTVLALQYFDTVLKKLMAMPDPVLDNLASVYNNIGATHAQAGNYPPAIAAFNKSIGYAVQQGSRGIEMENYRNMADMYESMKDYKDQSIYLKRYYGLKDSLFNNDNKNKLTELEADYQLEKKNTSLVKQETETQKQKSQRNIFIVIALGTVLLLVALAFFYRRIRQNNILLQEKNNQINKQKDELQTLNQVKDRLFSVISHDLRNPLVSLNGYISLADNANLAPEKKEAYKKQAQQAISQTGNMLDNLLVWANMQIKNTKPAITNINVEDCIDDAISAAKAQAEQKNIHINKNISIHVTPGDHNIIEIALRNIITNAVKYSNADTNITVSSFRNDAYTYITVKDEGIGMSQAKIDELLHNEGSSTPGTQGEKGSGLGLFLVKELLQKINAVLSIESIEGQGSNFTIKMAA